MLLEAGQVEPHYQIIIDRGRDHLDDLEVRVEAPADVHSSPNNVAQLERRLSYEIQSTLGITCTVKVLRPREIPRSEGKAVRVVDKRTL